MTTPRSPVPRRLLVMLPQRGHRPGRRSHWPTGGRGHQGQQPTALQGLEGGVGSSRRSPGFFRKALGQLLGHPVGFFEGEHGAPARHGGAGATAVDGRGHGQQGFALQRLGRWRGPAHPSAACRGTSRSLAAPCAPGQSGARHRPAQAAPAAAQPTHPSRQQRSSAARHMVAGSGGCVSCRHRGSDGVRTQVCGTAFNKVILSRVGSADLELSQGRAGHCV